MLKKSKPTLQSKTLYETYKKKAVLIKNEPWYGSKDFPKILLEEQGWEESLAKISKAITMGLLFYIFMRNLIIITFSKEILETRNSF